jgi:uncharacterized RmlC-like cupin family protein
MNTVDDCRMLDLPKVEMAEGNLTAVHGTREIPFEIARVFYVYDVVGGAERGGHAHVALEQVIVAVMGSFVVELDDGSERREVELNRAYHGLYVPTNIWAQLVNFSAGAIAVVLASLPFNEEEYIRDYGEFVRRRTEERGG